MIFFIGFFSTFNVLRIIIDPEFPKFMRSQLTLTLFVIFIISNELSGGTVNTEYTSEITETLVIGTMPLSVPNGISVYPLITISAQIGVAGTGDFILNVNTKQYFDISKAGSDGRNTNTNSISSIATSTGSFDTTGSVNTGSVSKQILTQGFVDG